MSKEIREQIDRIKNLKSINENLNTNIKVFRGHDEKFGLSIKNARWKALYFTLDYDFAKKFGDVNEYYINPKHVLDLTNKTIRKKVFNELSNEYYSYDQIENIYLNGDFPQTQIDSHGFNFTLINLILEYAKENHYDTIVMIEYYSKTITPIIYIVLDENIVIM